MQKSGVYAIIGVSGAYIGSSYRIEYRWRQHQARLRAGTHACEGIQSDHNEGQSLRFEILEECPRDVLIEREAYWGKAIELPVLNKSEPGRKGTWKRTAEERANVSAAAYQQWATPERLKKKYAMLECIRLGMKFTHARKAFGFHHWTARKWVDAEVQF